MPQVKILHKTLIVAIGLLFNHSYVSAHLVTTGLGPVYDGIGHLVMTPEDLVPVLAIALFAGLRGAAPGRRALFILPLAWFVGGILGVVTEDLPTLPVSAISFVVLGVLVAADLKLSPKVVHGHCHCSGFGSWGFKWSCLERRCRDSGANRYHGFPICHPCHRLGIHCLS